MFLCVIFFIIIMSRKNQMNTINSITVAAKLAIYKVNVSVMHKCQFHQKNNKKKLSMKNNAFQIFDNLVLTAVLYIAYHKILDKHILIP